MKTSKRQLENRYNPIKALSRNGNTWTFASETRSNVIYTTTRNGNNYQCSCPSKGLCKHIQSAVLEDASKKFGKVQIWTNEEDAKRQKRQMHVIRANNSYAWITIGEKNPLADVVRFCKSWDMEAVDLFYTGENGKSIHERKEGMDFNSLVKEAQKAGFVENGLYWVKQ